MSLSAAFVVSVLALTLLVSHAIAWCLAQRRAASVAALEQTLSSSSAAGGGSGGGGGRRDALPPPPPQQAHWSTKALGDMTERDWRIFREDFNISYKSLRDGVKPLRSWAEAALPPQLLQVRIFFCAAADDKYNNDDDERPYCGSD